MKVDMSKYSLPVTVRYDLNVICVDDDSDFLCSMKFLLDRMCRCTTVRRVRECIELMKKDCVDLVLLDIGLDNEDGIKSIKDIRAADSCVDVVMVTGLREPKLVVQAIRSGAIDYICKPIENEELMAVIEKVASLRKMKFLNNALIMDLKSSDQKTRLLGSGKAFRDIMERAARLKGHQANILIEGESGTGKELMARYLNNVEGDSKRPFIAVNCASIPDTLIESELFGHEKGAFTDAVCRKVGKFELADGGDIFLDEISTLKQELQAKILRVLQEKEISRLGGTMPIKVDFRVISASNENLDSLVAKGQFRMDLLHRLRVVELTMPALRDRTDDIKLLVEYFLERYSKPSNKKTMSDEALSLLKEYRWPGNIRELENLMHNLVIMAPGEVIEPEDMPDWIRKRPAFNFLPDAEVSITGDNVPTLKECLRKAERFYIEEVLKTAEGNKSKAADWLKVSRSTLHTKLKEFGIE